MKPLVHLFCPSVTASPSTFQGSSARERRMAHPLSSQSHITGGKQVQARAPGHFKPFHSKLSKARKAWIKQMKAIRCVLS